MLDQWIAARVGVVCRRLLACGLNSTATGMLAGKVVIEGFPDLRISRMRRALVMRGLAIVPAQAAAGVFGEHGSAELVVASRVLLCLSLPLAVVPLVIFSANREGEWRVRGVPLAAARMAATGCRDKEAVPAGSNRGAALVFPECGYQSPTLNRRMQVAA